MHKEYAKQCWLSTQEIFILPFKAIFLQYTVFKKNINGQQIYDKMLNITSHQWNANQNHNELSEWLKCKRQRGTNAGENVEKAEHFHTVGGNVN